MSSPLIVHVSGGTTYEGVNTSNIDEITMEFDNNRSELNPEIEELIKPALDRGYSQSDRSMVLDYRHAYKDTKSKYDSDDKHKIRRTYRISSHIPVDLDQEKKIAEKMECADEENQWCDDSDLVVADDSDLVVTHDGGIDIIPLTHSDLHNDELPFDTCDDACMSSDDDCFDCDGNAGTYFDFT